MPRRIMDYPTVFGGWHSIITSGHFLTVLSLIFFLFMLLDSFYENRAVVSRSRGVSRLNTRLSFYTYEIRKLRQFRSRSLVLQRSGGPVSTRAVTYATL
jgi:heme/copper-type cytochrome/quinol oxidase subunit 1